jgi:rubrerythrin
MKNTKTYSNLCIAFAGESQAQQRYKMFAKVAKKEGYNNISEVFLETAKNEYQHAKKFYELLIDLVGGAENLPNDIVVNNTYPLALGDTYSNLIEAAKGENEEVEGYSAMAVEAREEGYKLAAVMFDLISEVEAHHANRYTTLADLLNVDKLLSKDEETSWICDECGHVHHSNSAPGACPICAHPKGHFTKYSLNF